MNIIVIIVDLNFKSMNIIVISLDPCRHVIIRLGSLEQPGLKITIVILDKKRVIVNYKDVMSNKA